MSGRIVWTAALAVLCMAGCGTAPEPADLVLLGGRLVTLDDDRPEATALAARDGEIVAVGGDGQIRAYVGDTTEVLQLDGELVVPGFIDSHAHFEGLGRSLMILDASGDASYEDLVARVAETARDVPPGAWVLGRGWHQEKWERAPADDVEGFPTHEALSLAVPDHPVMLSHASGHAVLVNAAAMARAGIDRSTPDPPGGRILRRADGRATGVLQETAEDLAHAAIERDRAALSPEKIEADAERALRLADEACRSHGVTTLHDAGVTLESLERIVALAESGAIRTRLWIMLGEDNDTIRDRLAEVRRVDDRVTVRAIKRYADGALGSRGAWLLEPYEDQLDTSGMNVDPPEVLEEAARLAIEHEYQLGVHAIGDRANREVLDVYERVLGGIEDGFERRFRIEHAQHVDSADVPRFSEMGIVAAMQGVHCTSDGPWVEQRLGPERSRDGAYVWRSLLDSGAVICNGTDAPVEKIDPIANFHALVTRRSSEELVFYPEQRMTRTEALRASTLDGAYAGFEEDRKGSLTPGKLADAVVLSRDILEIPEDEIPGTEVLYTIVSGEVVYRGS